MTIYAHPARKIQEEADALLKKLGDGRFGNDQSAKELVAERKGLLRALELLRQPAKSNDSTEDL